MQISLDVIAGRYPHENIIMTMDGAGWHKSSSLILPSNLRIHFLPPYSPELNPQEHIWDELREKNFHNRTFDSMDVLEDHLVRALSGLEMDHDKVRSIVVWDWIINAISIAN
jgi:transposase